MRVRSLLVLLALIAALFLVKKLFFPSRQGPSGPPPGKGAPVAVNVKVVQPVYFEELVRSTGTILANEEVTLKAELSGRITGLFFKEGQAVEKGALMVKINDAELQAQLARVKLNLKLAEQRLERNRKLMEMQGISQEEFDRLQNEVETLRAERDLVLAQLEKSEIRAPFSGVAGLRQVSEGALVSSQQSIATLQQLNPLKLEFSLPEQYLGRVQSGDTVRYTTGSRQQEFDALVYAVEPLVDPATRSIRIRAYSAGTGGKVLPGAFASVRLRLSSSDALLIPTEAIVPVLKGKQVFIARSGKADTVSVLTGVRNDTAIQVLSGLKAGDTVITTGLLQVRAGSNISIKAAAK